MPKFSDGESTSPTLLARVGDWRDHDAWSDFVRRYDPDVRRFVRSFALDIETLEDLMQQIWIEVAQRIKTYTYDPSKTFRGWLRRVCHSRAIDLIRQRRPGVEFSIDRANDEGIQLANEEFDDEPCNDDRPEFVRLAEEVQAAVRRKIDDQTWRTFWEIVVEGHPIKETAQAHGLTYAAAFAAQKRVRKRLQDEGERLLRETARIPLGEATA